MGPAGLGLTSHGAGSASAGESPTRAAAATQLGPGTSATVQKTAPSSASVSPAPANDDDSGLTAAQSAGYSATCYPDWGWNAGEFDIPTIYPLGPLDGQPPDTCLSSATFGSQFQYTFNPTGNYVPNFESLNLSNTFSLNSPSFYANYASNSGNFMIYLPETSTVNYAVWSPGGCAQQPLNPQCHAAVYFNDIWTTIVGLGSSAEPGSAQIETPNNLAINVSLYNPSNEGSNTAALDMLYGALAFVDPYIAGADALEYGLDILLASEATDICGADPSACLGATQTSSDCPFSTAIGPVAVAGGSESLGECEYLNEPDSDLNNAMGMTDTIDVEYSGNTVPFSSESYIEVNAQNEQFNGSMAGGSAPYYEAGALAQDILPVDSAYGIGGQVYGSNGQPVNNATLCFGTSVDSCPGNYAISQDYDGTEGYWHWYGYPGTQYYVSVSCPEGGCSSYYTSTALPVAPTGLDYEDTTATYGPELKISEPLTEAAPAASPAAGVVGDEVTFTASPGGGVAPYSYTWTGLPTGCTSSDAPTVSCTPSAAGTFSVQVSVSDSNSHYITSGVLSYTVYTVPGQPTNFKVGTVTATGAPLSWTAPTQAITSYTILYAVFGQNPKGGTCDWPMSTLATGITTTSYTATGLTQGDAYCLEVEAVNPAGSSPPALLSNIQIGIAPTAPSSLAASGVTTSTVPLTWTLNTPVGYDVVSQAYATTPANTSTTETSVTSQVFDTWAGSLIVVSTSDYTSGTAVTVSDSEGNTWTSVGNHESGTTLWADGFYAVAKSTGTDTLTLSDTTSSQMEAEVVVYGGVGTIVTAGSWTDSTSTTDTPSVTTSTDATVIALYSAVRATSGVTAPDYTEAVFGYVPNNIYGEQFWDNTFGSAAAGTTSVTFTQGVATQHSVMLLSITSAVEVLQASYSGSTCGTYSVVGEATSPYDAYTVTGLASGTKYCFEVEGFDASGASISSAVEVSTASEGGAASPFEMVSPPTVASPGPVVLSSSEMVGGQPTEYART